MWGHMMRQLNFIEKHSGRKIIPIEEARRAPKTSRKNLDAIKVRDIEKDYMAIPEDRRDAIKALDEMNKYYFFRNWPRIKRNVEKNARVLHADWRQWKDTLKDKVSIHIGAGPSLYKNLDLLRELQDKAPVAMFCANVALPALREVGINPHFAVAVDRLSVPIKFGAEDPAINLIATYETNSEFVRQWRGPKHFVLGGSLGSEDLTTNRQIELLAPMFKKRARMLGKKQEIRRFRSGGNVGTFTHIVARDWFKSPAHILVGHDYGSAEPFYMSTQLGNTKRFTRGDYLKYAKFMEHVYLQYFSENIKTPYNCDYAVNCSLQGVLNHEGRVPNIFNMEFSEVQPALLKGGDIFRETVEQFILDHPIEIDDDGVFAPRGGNDDKKT